jgi:hypothetical protein
MPDAEIRGISGLCWRSAGTTTACTAHPLRFVLRSVLISMIAEIPQPWRSTPRADANLRAVVIGAVSGGNRAHRHWYFTGEAAFADLINLPPVNPVTMVRSTVRLEEFERAYTRSQRATNSYDAALAIFAALWRHAREINPDFPSDWRQDVKADIEMARVLNGLSDDR